MPTFTFRMVLWLVNSSISSILLTRSLESRSRVYEENAQRKTKGYVSRWNEVGRHCKYCPFLSSWTPSLSPYTNWRESWDLQPREKSTLEWYLFVWTIPILAGEGINGVLLNPQINTPLDGLPKYFRAFPMPFHHFQIACTRPSPVSIHNHSKMSLRSHKFIFAHSPTIG